MRTTPPGVWRALRDAYRETAFPLDVGEVKRLVVVTYFFTYALLLVVTATRSSINDATRSLPAAVRPPPLLPIEVVFGLPRSVSMGLLSLSTAAVAIFLVTVYALVRQPAEPSVPVSDDPDWPLAGHGEALSVVEVPVALQDVQFPRLPDVEHPFGREDDADRDDMPSLEEVFRHGGPRARLRPAWSQRDGSGAQTPRLRVDSVQVPSTRPEAVDVVQTDEEGDDEERDGWPGNWHDP